MQSHVQSCSRVLSPLLTLQGPHGSTTLVCTSVKNRNNAPNMFQCCTQDCRTNYERSSSKTRSTLGCAIPGRSHRILNLLRIMESTAGTRARRGRRYTGSGQASSVTRLTAQTTGFTRRSGRSRNARELLHGYPMPDTSRTTGS